MTPHDPADPTDLRNWPDDAVDRLWEALVASHEDPQPKVDVGTLAVYVGSAAFALLMLYGVVRFVLVMIP